MVTIMIRVCWKLHVVLIFVSFIAKDMEYFFIYLLAVCTSFESCLLNSFAHLLIGFVFEFKFFWWDWGFNSGIHTC
jgi:hypothetical protein